MSRVRLLSGLCAVAALGLTGCGGNFTASGDPLSDSEAADLASALAEGGFAGFGTFGAAAPSRAPREAATSITVAIDEAPPCDGGGTTAIKGSMTADVNQAGTGGTFKFNYTVAPNGCKVTTSGGKTFTLTGDPNLKVQGDFTFSDTGTASSFQGSLTYDGKFNWTSSDGRAGACGVDLTANYNFSFNTSGSSGSATLTGTVCGVTVNRQVTVTP